MVLLFEVKSFDKSSIRLDEFSVSGVEGGSERRDGVATVEGCDGCCCCCCCCFCLFFEVLFGDIDKDDAYLELEL